MRRITVTFLMLLLSLMSIAPELCSNITEDNVANAKISFQEKLFRESDLTIELLYNALVFNNIQNPEIVVKQSIIETGNFKSSIFKATNNPFGMHLPTYRQSLTTEFVYGDYYNGQYHKMAKFNCWYDAVLDFKYWQEFWLKDILTEKQYYKFLDTLPYAADPNYISKVKSIDLSKFSS
jgi:hypothetical protein